MLATRLKSLALRQLGRYIGRHLHNLLSLHVVGHLPLHVSAADKQARTHPLCASPNLKPDQLTEEKN